MSVYAEYVLASDYDALQAERDELLAALEGMIQVYGVREQHIDREPFASQTEVELCNQARALINKSRSKAK